MNERVTTVSLTTPDITAHFAFSSQRCQPAKFKKRDRQSSKMRENKGMIFDNYKGEKMQANL